MQNLISKHRIGPATTGRMEWRTIPGAPEDRVAAAVDALKDMGNIVSARCFTSPEKMTHDRVIEYALALIRLRECASAAGFDRLTNACDALAVTVSRLIEDRGAACRTKCEAMKRFVAHAQEMIDLAADAAMPDAPLIPDIRGASHRMRAGHRARIPM